MWWQSAVISINRQWNTNADENDDYFFPWCWFFLLWKLNFENAMIWSQKIDRSQWMKLPFNKLMDCCWRKLLVSIVPCSSGPEEPHNNKIKKNIVNKIKKEKEMNAALPSSAEKLPPEWGKKQPHTKKSRWFQKIIQELCWRNIKLSAKHLINSIESIGRAAATCLSFWMPQRLRLDLRSGGKGDPPPNGRCHSPLLSVC